MSADHRIVRDCRRTFRFFGYRRERDDELESYRCGGMINERRYKKVQITVGRNSIFKSPNENIDITLPPFLPQFFSP